MEVQFPFEILWFKRSLLLKVEDGGDGGAIGHNSILLKWKRKQKKKTLINSHVYIAIKVHLNDCFNLDDYSSSSSSSWKTPTSSRLG